jgi:hypothetical protein
MALVGVQHHGVAVLQREVFAGELLRRGEHGRRRRGSRHRQHDVVHQLGSAVLLTGGQLRAVLTGAQREVPVVDQRRGRRAAEQRLAVVGQDRLAAVAVDVAEVRLRAAEVAGAAGYLHHDLRDAAHDAGDLGDLLDGEGVAGGTPAAMAYRVQSQTRAARNGDDAFRHRRSPSSSGWR